MIGQMDNWTLAFGICGIVGTVVGTVGLLYSVRVNRHILKIGRLDSLVKLDVLAKEVRNFQRWLGSSPGPDNTYSFDETIAWDHYWHRLFGTVENFYSKRDQDTIMEIRQVMFYIMDNISGRYNISKNPLAGWNLQQCQDRFLEIEGVFNCIKPKHRWLY